MRILDVGCGLGHTSFLAGELVGSSRNVLSIDWDPVMVSKASERASGQSCSAWVHFQQTEISQFCCEQPFDVATDRYVLHH
jgi:2-polyprenyl-3-methyl-5-hydroxy-6-metoxy-1,4-benzoquinol methylase